MSDSPTLTEADRKRLARFARERVDDGLALRIERGTAAINEIIDVVLAYRRTALDLDLYAISREYMAALEADDVVR